MVTKMQILQTAELMKNLNKIQDIVYV